MAELEEGKTRWDYIPRPGPGQFTFRAVRDFLGLDSKQMRGYCERLGIQLTRYVREDRYLRKVYRRNLRYLTTAEAELIIRTHRMVQGARLERRQRRLEQAGEQ